MKPIIRDHIEQLDIEQGGGIVSKKIRVDTIDNPMLVIGLGGTGIDALLRLKYQINRRFNLPVDPMTKKRKDKPANIDFLAFETNEQDKNKKYKGIGLDPLNELVLLSEAGIGSILQNRSRLHPSISSWLSPELHIADGINGASGVRQAGRLLLFTKINQVVDAISKKIKELQKGTDRKIYIFILSGLSGGTGSGCFLDIAYITRAILDLEAGGHGIDRSDIMGYLFTPDVNLANPSLSIHTQEYIKKNGYAALKELDYWMNIEERGEHFKQDYGTRLSVNCQVAPFDLCHLISATDTEGKTIHNAYDYCMNVTAENITNFMASEDKQSGEEFAIHDYISNIETNIKQMKEAVLPANYKYNIIGASASILPIEEMTTYMAFKVFDRIQGMFDAVPKEEEVGDTVRRLGLDIDSMCRRFEQNVPEALPGFETREAYAYNNVIKTQAMNMDAELENNFLLRAREEFNRVAGQLPHELSETVADEVRRLFTSPEFGPIYASNMLVSRSGFCLVKTIEANIDTLKQQLAKLPEQIQYEIDTAVEKMQDARSAFISKEKKKNEYIETKISEYFLRADVEKYTKMIACYEELRMLLIDKNNKMYAVFKEILGTLNGIFKKDGEILIDANESVDEKGNMTYHWNVVSVKDVSKHIDKVIEDYDAGILVTEFTTMLLEQAESWINEAEIDIIGSISDFITDKFSDLISKTMEEFLMMKYGEEESLSELVEKQIASKLSRDAVPLFYMGSSSEFNFPYYAMVSVPTNTPAIYKGMKNFQEKYPNSAAKFSLRQSKLTNRIFWVTTRNGVPLYAYGPMKSYEQLYEETIRTREGVGRHLVMSDKENWTDLPSPIPVEAWGDTYTNERISEKRKEEKELFEKGLQYHIIEHKEDSTLANQYVLNTVPDFDLEAQKAGYDINMEKPNFTVIKKAIEELKGQVANGLKGEKVTFYVMNSYDEHMAFAGICRYPKHEQLLRNEIKKFEAVEAYIATLEEVVAGAQQEEKNIESFIKAIYTKTLFKKGALYIYDKDEEEDFYEPLLNVMDVNKYAEYELYKRFTAMTGKLKEVMIRKSERRVKSLTQSEDVSELLGHLDNILAKYGEAREEIEDEIDEVVDGHAIYEFYRQVLGYVKELKRKLN